MEKETPIQEVIRHSKSLLSVGVKEPYLTRCEHRFMRNFFGDDIRINGKFDIWSNFENYRRYNRLCLFGKGLQRLERGSAGTGGP